MSRLTRFLVRLCLASTVTFPAQARPLLAPGDVAPAFVAKGDDGKGYTLEQFKGRFVVLYFYPRDQTPGCTAEARAFQDDSAAYAEKGAVVLGVSFDDAASHRAFREKHGLTFPLLVGTDALAEAYGVHVHFGFASRQTFVIGRDGRLKHVFRDVDVGGHSKEILRMLN